MSDFVLIPYIEVNGSWALPDDAMKGLYRMMVKEKTSRKVWYSGSVQSEDDFVRVSKSMGTHTVIILTKDGKPGAISWLNNFLAASAQIHFVLFREVWGEKSQEVGQMALDYFFGLKNKDGDPFLKVLMGITPESYDLAIRYIKSLGVTVIGTIPNFLHNYYTNETMGAVISYLERRN
jgi:hypothetical protein